MKHINVFKHTILGYVIILGVVAIFTLWNITQASKLSDSISWLYTNDLTIYNTVESYNPDRALRRDEAAKFFVHVAEMIDLKESKTLEQCQFDDLALWHNDLHDIMIKSCKLWLFQGNWWAHFMPTDTLTNGQAITVFVRLLDGRKNETHWHYATHYRERAMNEWILTKLSLEDAVNFDKPASRGEVWIMIFQANHLLTDSTSYFVTRVIDGDTIEILSGSDKMKVRLIGVDAPETSHPSKWTECYWVEASQATRRLLENKRVTLESDSTQTDKDIYDRYLRYVYTLDGIFVNQRLIEQGYGQEYTYKVPYIYQFDFKQAQSDAQSRQHWMWAEGACDMFDAQQAEQERKQREWDYLYYTSSHHSAVKYYCETDSAWKWLSERYLQSFNSEQALLDLYSNKTLNKPC